eukprot:11194847-Alexandrium_andersonii.AAC.1
MEDRLGYRIGQTRAGIAPDCALAEPLSRRGPRRALLLCSGRGTGRRPRSRALGGSESRSDGHAHRIED